MKLIAVTYNDHYSTNDLNERECIAFACGLEVPSINDEYLRLLHVKADANDHHSAAEYHNIFRVAIIDKEEFELKDGFTAI